MKLEVEFWTRDWLVPGSFWVHIEWEGLSKKEWIWCGATFGMGIISCKLFSSEGYRFEAYKKTRGMFLKPQGLDRLNDERLFVPSSTDMSLEPKPQ